MKNLIFLTALVFFAACEKPEITPKTENVLQEIAQNDDIVNSYNLVDCSIINNLVKDKWQSTISITNDGVFCEFLIESKQALASSEYSYNNDEFKLLSNIIIIDDVSTTDKKAIFNINFYEGRYYITFSVFNEMGASYFEGKYTK